MGSSWQLELEREKMVVEDEQRSSRDQPGSSTPPGNQWSIYLMGQKRASSNFYNFGKENYKKQDFVAQNSGQTIQELGTCQSVQCQSQGRPLPQDS